MVKFEKIGTGGAHPDTPLILTPVHPKLKVKHSNMESTIVGLKRKLDIFPQDLSFVQTLLQRAVAEHYAQQVSIFVCGYQFNCAY